MTVESRVQFEAKVKAARETIAAYKSRLGTMASHISCLCGGGFWDGGATIDFRPVMRDYARSTKLDSMLLESEMLYKELIPTMIRTTLEWHYPDDRWVEHMRYPRGDDEIATDDETWVEIVAGNGGYDFLTYTHAEFVQVAQQKEAGVAGGDSH
jgi:hypothetical protein